MIQNTANTMYAIVCCPNCDKERFVSRIQFWQIANPKGRSSGNCKSCSLLSNKYQPKTHEAYPRQIMAMIGNQWRKGIVDMDHIKELAIRNKGNRHNPKLSLRGEQSPFWKGGLGSERHRLMGQQEYKAWRSAVFARDNYICQICEASGGYVHADHIKSWSKFPELRFDVNNGRTLCRSCHYYITFKNKMPAGSNWGLTSVTEKEG